MSGVIAPCRDLRVVMVLLKSVGVIALCSDLRDVSFTVSGAIAPCCDLHNVHMILAIIIALFGKLQEVSCLLVGGVIAPSSDLTVSCWLGYYTMFCSLGIRVFLLGEVIAPWGDLREV